MSSLKDDFLKQTKAARLEREKENKHILSAVIIQKTIRGFLVRRRLYRKIMMEFDDVIKDWNQEQEKVQFENILKVFKVINKFIFIFDEKRDLKAFEKMCKYIIATMFVNENDKELSYASVAFDQRFNVAWIRQLKTILIHCSSFIKFLKPDNTSDYKCIMLFLNMMIIFTSTHTWPVFKNDINTNVSLRNAMNSLCSNVMCTLISKGFFPNLQSLLIKGLCRTKPTLNKSSLTAIITLSLRPLINSQFQESFIKSFLIHIFSTPALVHHLTLICPDTLSTFSSLSIFPKSIQVLNDEQNCTEIFKLLQANYALCLVANLINLAFMEQSLLQKSILDFVIVIGRLLENCQKYVSSKQSSLTHWHPILGYFAQNVDYGLHESFPSVKKQLSYLWNPKMIHIIFGPLWDFLKSVPDTRKSTQGNNIPVLFSKEENSLWKTNPLRKTLGRASVIVNKAVAYRINSGNTSSASWKKLGTPEVMIISFICSMYVTALNTLTQLKLDILTGLCYQDLILPSMWKFISSFGPKNGLNAYIDHLTLNLKARSPEFQILILFCDCATHLITILDEKELYEEQKPFKLEDLLNISSFLNNFIFKIIWNNLIDLKCVNQNQLLNSTHSLLMVLYKRDCRREYAQNDHWLIKDLKISHFMKDLENGKKAAQILMTKVPHIVSHKERVVLFRRHVSNEKIVLGLTESACAFPQSTLITVHRSAIVEDGYQQLAMLPSNALKGVIRVKFINEQGLDEAGIDQDGVFKEFLEETIKKVFDPSLNLFRVTSEQRLYPSPTSYVHENHLSLFEFVGKMLGKAVYEGIVVDVPFASFFLSQVLGQQQTALYSSIDELPSLDPELYKSLTYIKHCESDVSDFDLTFSVDEDCMGKIVTYELVPGGKVISVTKETKISYIHLMAHFRMHRQIHEQTAAFIRGFRSIVNPDWLTMFSTPEFQRLISGDNAPIDLADLRRNTKYYGGFHSNHRVINWFWEILEKDFKPEEHRLLLKFVTSCSKPPLLGFTHLQPQFSIRCVEVSDDQDVGDTVGSVLRGFFTIGKKDPINRLPTSSTCFNLLKLPNYQKKSTLKEKLRYAIANNTGFELS